MWSSTSVLRTLFLAVAVVDSCLSYTGISKQTNDSNGDLSVLPPLPPLTDIPTRPPYQIVGGLLTLTGEFPYMAALGWRNEDGKLDYLCGGVLITSYMVLTAAHCVYLDGKIPDVVAIGGHSLSVPFNTKYPVVNVTIYPQYNSTQAYYDIALLKLGVPTTTPPVCLWTKPNLYVNNVTAIGYGLTEFAGAKAQDLMKVNLTIFPEKFCQPFFKRQRKFKNGLSHAHICAGDQQGQKDTCQGDSGGPLIVWHKYRPYTVGITSTGQGCSGFPPAIYTKVSSYIGWIIKVLNENGAALGRECS